MSPNDIAELAERLVREQRPYAVATVVRSLSTTSAKPGAKAVVAGDGTMAGWIGGGCAQPAVRNAAKRAIADGRARLIRIHPDAKAADAPGPDADGAGADGVEAYAAHCHSGGTLDIFIEPMLPPPALIVIGDSPVGGVLARLAANVGFGVAVIGTDKAIEVPPAPAGAAQFIVVATQGRKDRQGLQAALAAAPFWVGFIASRRKAAALFGELIEAGVDRAGVERIRAPAGLDIGAVTPEEIAVAILAEIMGERRAMLAVVTEEVEPAAAKSAARSAAAE